MRRHFVWNDWWSFLRWASVVEPAQGPGGLYVGCYLALHSSLSLPPSWPSLLPHCHARVRVKGGERLRDWVRLGGAVWASGALCACMLGRVRLLVPGGPQPARLLCPGNLPGKNAGVGCHLPRQGIFLTQGSNPRPLHLLHWQAGFFFGCFFLLCCFFAVEPAGNHYSATKMRWKFNDLFSIHDQQGPTVYSTGNCAQYSIIT